MNLREVREAAEYQKNWYGSAEGGEYIFKKHLVMCNYILATIDPSPDLPITAEWLQEEWGFEEIGVMDSDKFYLDHDYSHYLIILKDGIGVFYFDCDDGDLWPHDLHTRQQFCDLARCLGIPKQKAKLEQSNESCGKCGEKLKQTKKGVQYCECWMPQPPDRSV